MPRHYKKKESIINVGSRPGTKTEKKQETATEDKEIELKPDTWLEKEHYRKAAAETAAKMAFNLFDVYKKAHGMVSYT